MDVRWYEPIKRAFSDLLSLTASFNGQTSTLGTAAFKNIGTSGGTVPLLNTANTFSKSQTFDVVTLEDAASIAWDWSLGPIAKVTLTDNRTLAAPTGLNGKAGTWALFVRQSAGSNTLAYDNVYLFPNGTDPTLSTAAGALDVLTFVTDGSAIVGSITKAFA